MKYASIRQLTEMGYGSRSTIMRHIAIGGFTAKNPGGGKWIVDLADYERWLRERSDMRRAARW